MYLYATSLPLISRRPRHYAKRRMYVELIIIESLKNSPFNRRQLDTIFERITEFCNTPAPRQVADFREEIKVVIDRFNNPSLSILDLEPIIGHFNFVIQQGYEAAML